MDPLTFAIAATLLVASILIYFLRRVDPVDDHLTTDWQIVIACRSQHGRITTIAAVLTNPTGEVCSTFELSTVARGVGQLLEDFNDWVKLQPAATVWQGHALACSYVEHNIDPPWDEHLTRDIRTLVNVGRRFNLRACRRQNLRRNTTTLQQAAEMAELVTQINQGIERIA